MLASVTAIPRITHILPREARTTPMQKQMTAVINRDGDVYVAFCPELDIASQGASIESARDNLREALELFFESASADEIRHRLREDVFVTRVEVAVG